VPPRLRYTGTQAAQWANQKAARSPATQVDANGSKCDDVFSWAEGIGLAIALDAANIAGLILSTRTL